MSLTIELPKSVEQAYLSAAKDQGVSIDALVTDVLVKYLNSETPELIEELGIQVLRTGQPLEVAVVRETLETIRRERDLTLLGQS